jgi:hypothetical protein
MPNIELSIEWTGTGHSRREELMRRRDSQRKRGGMTVRHYSCPISRKPIQPITPDVRYWYIADIDAYDEDVRFWG